MNKYLLRDISTIYLSNLDKISKENETQVRLCNFVDVYNNWEITYETYKSMMIASATHDEISKFGLKKGMLAITKDSETRDDIGMAAYISEAFDDVVLGYHTALIIPDNKKVDSKYLNAFLQSNTSRKYFKYNASGSGQRYTLTLDSIENLPVFLPSMDIQKRVGEFLSDLNQKIENNNKINSELESLAKTIYDYWFLQFDFPNEEGKPYKSSGGAMEYNEQLKMDIPKGWEVKPLGSIIVEQPKSPVQVGQVEGNKGNIPFFTSGDAILRYNNKIVSGRNLFLNTGGKAGLKYYVGDVAYSTDTWCISGIDNLSDYLYLNLAKIEYALDRVYFTGSTGLEHLQKPLLKKREILVPPSHILDKFNKIVQPMFDMISENTRENQELTNLRDYLLPLLMNGQVGFKDE